MVGYCLQYRARVGVGWYLGCIGISFVDTCPALLGMFCASIWFFSPAPSGWFRGRGGPSI